MLAKTPAGPQAQQMVMMSRIMPLFMGFISLSFASALSLYWVVGNIWMIGQQHFTLKHRETPAQPAVPAKHGGKAKSIPPAGGKSAGNGKVGGPQAGKRSRKRRS
jgi:YidC/Oxa1 family membrane protein insertase